MTLRRSLLATLTGAALISCTDAPPPSAPELTTLAQAEGVGHRVTGSGHVQTQAGLREFTFHAIESPSGDVSGSFKIVLPNGLFLEVDVVCMAVEGDTGWVSGRIRDTNANPALIGTGSMFYATDGGVQGQDQVSTAAFGTPEALILEFCAERPRILALMNVTDGNVQVR